MSGLPMSCPSQTSEGCPHFSGLYALSFDDPSFLFQSTFQCSPQLVGSKQVSATMTIGRPKTSPLLWAGIMQVKGRSTWGTAKRLICDLPSDHPFSPPLLPTPYKFGSISPGATSIGLWAWSNVYWLQSLWQEATGSINLICIEARSIIPFHLSV